MLYRSIHARITPNTIAIAQSIAVDPRRIAAVRALSMTFKCSRKRGGSWDELKDIDVPINVLRKLRGLSTLKMYLHNAFRRGREDQYKVLQSYIKGFLNILREASLLSPAVDGVRPLAALQYGKSWITHPHPTSSTLYSR